MGIWLNRKNNVVEHQRMYQQAYRAHTRIWKIHPRSPYLLYPYYVLMWGTLASTIYMMGRKVAGYNTWFGKN